MKIITFLFLLISSLVTSGIFVLTGLYKMTPIPYFGWVAICFVISFLSSKRNSEIIKDFIISSKTIFIFKFSIQKN
jgi:hypothetical protein